MLIQINKHWTIHFFSKDTKSQATKQSKIQLKLGLSLDEEECKNSIQSSTVSALCESVRSEIERDLTKVDEEETFLEDLLFMETLFIELATFVPSCTKNFSGDDNFDSVVNLKFPLPISLLLRKIVGMSLTLGLKHTLLLLIDILSTIGELLVGKKSVSLVWERERETECVKSENVC